VKSIRILFCAFFLLGGITLQAAPVSQSRALDVAKRVFAAQPATKAAGDVKLIWDGEDIATKSAVQPAFYVFGRDGGGFVIIAGDDNVTPVLAVSDRNVFKVEEMPDNVKWWMERMKAYVRAAKTQTPDIRDQWLAFTATKEGGEITGEVTNKVEHLTPEWNQAAIRGNRLVFNSKCPIDKKDPTQRTLTGCVATAISEVLTTLSGLYEMPSHASNGPIAPYTVDDDYKETCVAATDVYPYDGQTRSYELGVTYQWSELRKLMKSSDLVEASDAVLDNLDTLMADIGAMMHAMYSAGITLAATGMAPDTMMKYMGISKTAYYDVARNYLPSQWRSMLKNELKDRPIVYTGQNAAGGGHAFVFDGYGTYNGEDVFHVNFGWGGTGNGYYYETNLDLNGSETYNFSFECGACFNFYPDPASDYPLILKLTDLGGSEGFNYTSEPPVQAGDNLNMNTGTFINIGKTAYSGTLKFVAEKKSGGEPVLLYSYSYGDDPSDNEGPFDPAYGDFFSFSVPIPFDVALGDKVVCYYSTNAARTEWAKLEPSTRNGSVIHELPLMPVPFIKTADSYKVNDWFELVMMNIAEPYDNAKWTITEPDGKVLSLVMANQAHKLTKTGTYRIEAKLTKETIVTYIQVD
jgi:hypothetical protein